MSETAKPETDHNLTVKELRESLADLDDDSPVYYERIEDCYFQDHGGWMANLMEIPGDMGGLPRHYIRGFTSFKYKNTLCITAHY